MTDITPVVLEDLTTATLEGTGVFDTLMRATKVHLQEEFARNRIKGPEYAQVYLGSLTEVMQQSLTFLMEKDKSYQQAKLITAQVALAEQQALNAAIEGQNLVLQADILEQQAQNLQAERENMQQQKDLIEQQVLNLQAEALNIPKQGLGLDAETARTEQLTENLAAEKTNIAKQGDLLVAQAAQVTKQSEKLTAEKEGIVAQTALTTQQKANLTADALNIPKQGQLLDAQKEQVTQQSAKVEAETLNLPKQGALLDQQTANAITENDVMTRQICKLQAEYDVLMEQKLKTVAEAELLTQKRSTEKAQISSMGVDPDSIIGKQVTLYHAQADGFKRDAEQKAAKLMVDSWNVRRTTDESTVADSTNMLSDAHVGRTITRLLAGVNA